MDRARTPLDRLRAALAGHYTIERELGRGGMATVYLARDLKHERPVALKPYAAAALAQAYGGAGDRAAALRVIDDLQQRSTREYVPPVHIAMAYGGVGDLAQGMAWMTRAVDPHDIYIPENFFEPLLDPLRKDPGFRRFYPRMGLTAP